MPEPKAKKQPAPVVVQRVQSPGPSVIAAWRAVPSGESPESPHEFYDVRLKSNGWSCDCAGYMLGAVRCKHIRACQAQFAAGGRS